MEASLLSASSFPSREFELSMETDNKVREMFAPAEASQTLRQETDNKIRE